MKNKIMALVARVMMVVGIVFAVSGTAFSQTTYKLEQVTSVSAGGLYVFEQDGYVMNNTVSSNALQTTSTYKTTSLAGNETYVWTLETATNGFYIKNLRLNSNQYINNESSTNVSLGATSSIWSFNFQNDNTVLIQNNSNSNRFLGYTTSTSHAYKAYATSNLSSYSHAIKVYQLVEEGGGSTLTDSDLALTGAPITLSFDLYNNFSAQTVSFTTSSTGAISVSESEYISTSNSGNTITVTPVNVTPSAQTITINQAADATYAAGTATFTVSVTDSTPYHNVTYKANGGTGSDIVRSYKEGTDVTVEENTFSYAGHNFTKWNTAADGQGTDYLPEATITSLIADVDLFAQWEESNETTYDFTNIDGFDSWDTNYSQRIVTYSDATVTFASANRQTSTITNQPVTKGGEVSLVLTDGSTMSKATFVCTQWTTKAQIITLYYSTDGGTSYTSTNVTSSNFTISKDNLPEGTNAVKITFNSTSNQVGIASASIEKIAPSPTISADNVNIAYDATNGSIDYSINNKPTPAGTLTADSDDDWLTLGEVSASSVSFTCTANSSYTSREATITLTYTYDTNKTVTKTVTVTQAAPVVDYATLPFTWNSGFGTAPTGITINGTTEAKTDYLNMKATSAEVILKINEIPGTLTFDIRGNSFSGGTFKVQTSANGIDYTDLASYTELGSAQSEEFSNFPTNVRYIKWIYTEKHNGNVGIGNISLTALNPAASSITLSAAPSGGRYWTTYFNSAARYSLPAGAQAFTMNASKQLFLLGADGSVIPANVAVIIIADSPEITLTKSDETSSITINGGTNILQGANSNVAKSGISGTPYVLGIVNNTLGFYQFSGSSIPAMKAYYVVVE